MKKKESKMRKTVSTNRLKKKLVSLKEEAKGLLRKCPDCKSRRVTSTHQGEVYCRKCGLVII